MGFGGSLGINSAASTAKPKKPALAVASTSKVSDLSPKSAPTQNTDIKRFEGLTPPPGGFRPRTPAPPPPPANVSDGFNPRAPAMTPTTGKSPSIRSIFNSGASQSLQAGDTRKRRTILGA